jgi:hypothetical protein
MLRIRVQWLYHHVQKNTTLVSVWRQINSVHKVIPFHFNNHFIVILPLMWKSAYWPVNFMGRSHSDWAQMVSNYWLSILFVPWPLTYLIIKCTCVSNNLRQGKIWKKWSLYLSGNHAMKTNGGMTVQLHTFLILALEIWEIFSSMPWERAQVPHSVGGSMFLTAVLDVMERWKVSHHARNRNKVLCHCSFFPSQ